MKATKRYDTSEKEKRPYPARLEETYTAIQAENPGRSRERAFVSGRERWALRRVKRWQWIAFVSIAAALILGGVLLFLLFAQSSSGGSPNAGNSPTGKPLGSQTENDGAADGKGTDKKEKDTPVICIDPGHGFTKSSGILDVGCDVGAYHDLTGKYEADLNLEISLLLREELERRGYTVVMTREKNEEKILEISDRPGYINSLNPDLCISIHGNSFDGSVTGTRVFVNDRRSDCDPFGAALVKAVNDARVQIPSLTSPAASLKKDSTGIAVLRAVNCPVALVETCFLDAETDAVKAASDLWRSQMASALADGIQAFLPPGKGA